MVEDNPFLEHLERLEKVNSNRKFLAVNMGGFLVSRILGTDWVLKHLVPSDYPDPWMLNSKAWLGAHAIATPDIRRAIHAYRVEHLADALFTVVQKVDKNSFEVLRQRFLQRNDTRASFYDAEIASLLVYNGCRVKIVGESGVRGEDFDLLATVNNISVSVEVTSLLERTPSVRSILNKLNNKRTQVPSNKPGILYVVLSEGRSQNMNLSFLVLNAAVRNFMIKSRRINAIVFLFERAMIVSGGYVVQTMTQAAYNNRARWPIPDYSVFSPTSDKWGQPRWRESFIATVLTGQMRRQLQALA